MNGDVMTERLRDSCNSGKMGNSQDHSRTFIHPSVHPSIHPSQDSTPTQMSLASKCLSGKWCQTFGPGHTGDKTNHCWPGDVQRFSLRKKLSRNAGWEMWESVKPAAGVAEKARQMWGGWTRQYEVAQKPHTLTILSSKTGKDQSTPCPKHF